MLVHINVRGAKSQLRHIKFGRPLHIGCMQLEMVQPLGAAAAVQMHLMVQARHHRHTGAKFNRCAYRIGEMQGEPLKRHLRPVIIKALQIQKPLGRSQILS